MRRALPARARRLQISDMTQSLKGIRHNGGRPALSPLRTNALERRPSPKGGAASGALG